jgi:hypothetical protein
VRLLHQERSLKSSAPTISKSTLLPTNACIDLFVLSLQRQMKQQNHLVNGAIQVASMTMPRCSPTNDITKSLLVSNQASINKKYCCT